VIDPVANEAAATPSDGHVLAERYEVLRREIVEADQHHGGVRGVALLMRKGMAAWMKSVAEVPVRAASTVVAPPVTQLPHTLEQRLIDIVATMAFTSARENHP
jgi:hypothetical protein